MTEHESEAADLERRLTAVIARAAEAIETAKTEAAARAAEAASYQHKLTVLNDALAAAETRLQILTASTIWRATSPLRRIAGSFPAGLRQTLRRAARVLWWSVTLQLGARVRTYRAARSYAEALPSPGLPAIGRAAPQLAGPDETAPARPSAAVGAEPSLHDRRPPARLPKTGRPRAFIIDSRWPRPDQDSGSIDAVTQIRALDRLGYEIVFASDIEYDATIRYRLQLELEGVICLSAALSPSIADFLESDGGSIDLCILSRVSCGGRYLEAARRHAPRAKIIFNTVDLHHLREAREARLLGDAALLRQAEVTRIRELHIARHADATIVVSAAERLALEQAVPGAMIVDMPLARRLHAATHIPGFAERCGVGFVGGFEHPPNIDAVRYLLAEIWPLVLARRPGATLSLVGKGLPAALLDAAPRGVSYLGHLPTLDPWLDAIRLTVAPLRYGAGAKGKVASSLAAGVPCVSTAIGAEGMGLEDGVHLAVADTPEDFAQRICAVHEDAALWQRLSEGGYEKARRHFSVSAGQERLAMLLRSLNPAVVDGPSQGRRATVVPFETMHEQDITQARRQDLERTAPCLRRTIDYLNYRQARPEEAVIRSFQADILTQGFFEVPSPFTGRLVQSGESLVLPNRNVFYRFPSEPQFLLAAANLGRGYPIVGLILLNAQKLITLDQREWGIDLSDVDDARDILARDAWAVPQPASSCVILTGDTNFAHHAWNQLGAIEALARLRPADQPVEIFTTFTPLGPIAELFPELADWPIKSLPPTIPDALNVPGRVIVNLGGLRVTDSTRRRVLRVAQNRASEFARSARLSLASRRPVIWISIRTRNRTPINQRAFVMALCRSIFSTYPAAAVILDGHSTPVDRDTNYHYDRNDIDETISRDRQEIDDIVDALATEFCLNDDQLILKAVGLTILDSILLAHHADFYICHHGTVQHKIGWMTDAAGVVHSNPRTLAINPGPWVALQAGHERTPIYFPPGLIGEVPETVDAGDINSMSRLFDPYVFLNIEDSVDFCMGQISNLLSKTVFSLNS